MSLAFQHIAEARCFGTVGRTPEFRRIQAIPRRVLDLENALDLTPLFQRPHGQLSLWKIQSVALAEASRADGLVAPIQVGGGKELISLLLPEAMDAERAIILTKPSLKVQMIRNAHERWGKHFRIDFDRFRIYSYAELSSAKKADLLEREEIDLLVCDEAHYLRNLSSARGKRFERFTRAHPRCRYAFLSGTLLRRSIRDIAPFFELALRKNSPLPKGYHELNGWAGALDKDPDVPFRPGVLKEFCQAGETVRQGVHRRLAETLGVVYPPENHEGLPSLVIRRLSVQVPADVQKGLTGTRTTWKVGDEELVTALEHSAALAQLSCGFFYRWVWPGGQKNHDWLEARSLWRREVREKLKRAAPKLDSPFLLQVAAERHREWDLAGRPKPRPDHLWDSVAWEGWRELRHIPPPAVEPVWVSDFLVDAAIAWGKQKRDVGAIIWYSFRAVGQRISEKGGFPLYGPGTDAGLATAPVIVCSVQAQGTGKNLQHRYAENLILSLPPNGEIFEQLVGRTHREGQEADEVLVDWFGHTDELRTAMEQVKRDAELVKELDHRRQKVLYATHLEDESKGSEGKNGRFQRH